MRIAGSVESVPSFIDKSSLLAAIVESSDDAIISKTLDGIITSWNRGAERMFGYTALEAIGQSITMLIPPDRQNEEPAILERVRRGERIDHYQTVRRDKFGRLIEISLTISAVRDASGNIVGASKIARAISHRALDDSYRHLLAAIVASSDDAIISKDINGIITSWNEAAERLFGYSAIEVIGRPITVIVPPDRLEEEALIMARVRRGEQTTHFETIRRRKDGTLIDLSLTVSPVRDAHGGIIGASKIARDISSRQAGQTPPRPLTEKDVLETNAGTESHVRSPSA